MIGVTESAKERLKTILSDNVDNPQASLRLTTDNQGGLGLGIDVAQPDDQVVEHEGSKVLVVEKGLADTLEGVTLDAEDTPEGPKLVISKEPQNQ